MSADPKIKGLVRKRDLLEEQIRSKRLEGQQTALADAERDVASAGQAVASLQQQLDAQQQQVMEFTTRFAEHEALQEELLQIEALHREAQDRLLQLQVNVRSQYPQVRLEERPFLPEYPVYPDYWRDAGISVAVSLLAGLLLLMLFDFLNRPARHASAHDIRQVFVTAPHAPLPWQEARMPLQQPAAVPALEQQLPRELSPAEILELLRTGGADIRLLISCLLSGLTVDELCTLCWEDIDSKAGVIQPGGEDGRTISLSAALRAAVADWTPPDMTPAGLVWQTADGRSPAMDDFAAMLLYTAHDAGLTRPSEVTLEAVRHTYIGYLVRQGAQLSALPRLVGGIPPRTLAAYASYSPPGAGAPLESVESVYPALQSFYQPKASAGPTPDQSV
jgi:succinoglycan biosynthesis transport protein ExoP